MESQNLIKEKKTFFHTMAEFLFTVYFITLYVFVDKKETLMISKLVFLAFAGVTVLHLLQRRRFHLGKNVLLVYLCFSWMFAAVTWAANSYLASFKMRTMWQIFILFFLVYNLFYENKDAHESFLKNLYIAGIALIGYSIYTYGFSEVIEMMTSSDEVRLGRDISQENTFGMLNATTCIVAFYYLFYSNRFKVFHMVALAMAFVLAMGSGSKRALLVTCLGILFLVYQKFGLRQVYKVVAVVLVLALIFVAVIQLPAFETIRLRMEQGMETISGGKGDSSSNIRLNMMKDGWNLFKNRILIGYGADNYRVVGMYSTYSHNNFTEMLVGFGLIGFLLYYVIYLNAFKSLISLKNDASRALLCIFLIRFVMEIAMVTYYDKVHWILMAFFLIEIQNDESDCKGEETELDNKQICYK